MSQLTPVNPAEQRTALRVIAQEAVFNCDVRESAHHVTVIVKTKADAETIVQAVRGEGWYNINTINGAYTNMHYVHIMLNRS